MTLPAPGGRGGWPDRPSWPRSLCGLAALLSFILSFQICRQLYRGRGGHHQWLKTVHAEPRFWRLAPLSATCIGTAWALQGLWAAPMAPAMSAPRLVGIARHFADHGNRIELGALLWGVAVIGCADVVSTAGAVGLVAMIFIAAQLALILRLPLPSYVRGSSWRRWCWTCSSVTRHGRVLPTELAGRANAALDLFHIGGAFVVQYMTGLVV